MLLLGCLAACASVPSTSPLPVLDQQESVAEYEGRLVTLRGVLQVGKGDAILLGVSVHHAPGDLHGAPVEATGILRRWQVPEPTDPFASSAQRVGTFFTLDDPQDPSRRATVRRLDDTDIMEVRLRDLLDGPDDLKIVEGMLQVAARHVEDGDLAPATRLWIEDLRRINDAWYRVPNGGYHYLLETDGDPITPLRAACERFGHTAALPELDAVRAVFPDGRVPDAYADKAPFLDAADRQPGHVFDSDEIVPVVACWARRHRDAVLAVDGPVDVPAEPRELAAGAQGAIAAHWFRAVGAYFDPADGGPIRRLGAPEFRRDLDRFWAQVARWRGAAGIESLSVRGVRSGYWSPVPFAAFSRLREFDGSGSGLTDADVDGLLRLPDVEQCDVFAAERITADACARLRERFGERCRL